MPNTIFVGSLDQPYHSIIFEWDWTMNVMPVSARELIQEEDGIQQQTIFVGHNGHNDFKNGFTSRILSDRTKKSTMQISTHSLWTTVTVESIFISWYGSLEYRPGTSRCRCICIVTIVSLPNKTNSKVLNTGQLRKIIYVWTPFKGPRCYNCINWFYRPNRANRVRLFSCQFLSPAQYSIWKWEKRKMKIRIAFHGHRQRELRTMIFAKLKC